MRVRENSLILEIVAIVVSYLLGSVSFSVLLAKILKGIDIRQHGGGNAGATNTLRVLGKGPAILVLALDVIKGIARFGSDDGSGRQCVAAGIVRYCGHYRS